MSGISKDSYIVTSLPQKVPYRASFKEWQVETVGQKDRVFECGLLDEFQERSGKSLIHLSSQTREELQHLRE